MSIAEALAATAGLFVIVMVALFIASDSAYSRRVETVCNRLAAVFLVIAGILGIAAIWTAALT